MSRESGLLDATVAEAEGDHATACGWYATAVESSRTIGYVVGETYSLAGLGRCLLALGRTEEGVSRLQESRAIWERLKATPRIVEIDAILAKAR